MTVLSHPLGSQFVRQALKALVEAGELAAFHTSVAWRDGGRLAGVLPASVVGELRRRSYLDVPASLLHTHPWREMIRLAGPRLGLGGLARHETGWASVDAVFQSLDRKVSRALPRHASSGVRTCYAYEDGALDTFREAKRLGLRCVYDLPIGYHARAARIFAEEAEHCPEFAPMLDGLRDSARKLERKACEAALADCIVVPSRFVADTLTGSSIPAERIRIVPFGAPAAIQPRNWTAADTRRPLRLLFAGSIGQRKGIGYLLQAVRQLRRADVELILMGSFVGDASPLAPYRDLFRHEPTRPHAQVLELMKTCDVLVLPSLWEGLAQVQLEALACGLPILITPNTGGAHLVREGQEGFVVPMRSPEALAERIAWFADNRDQLPRMGHAAAERARVNGWETYRRGILAACRGEAAPRVD